MIHTANTVLVFWFLLRTTQPAGRVHWSRRFCAAPVARESVACIGTQRYVVHIFRHVVTIAYVRYAEAFSIRRYAWTAIMLALVNGQTTLVTWPFVMLLLDYWPLHRFQKSDVRSQRSEVSGQWSVVRGLIIEKIPLLVPWRRPRL
jgi:hypothetical protein